MLPSPSLHCSPQDRRIHPDELLGQRITILFRKLADHRDGGLVAQRTILLRVRIQASFILKWEGAWLVANWCWNLLFLQLYTRSDHKIPINLQPDKCYSLFCNFLSLLEWETYIALKVRTLRMGYILQPVGNILLQRCRVSMTKHKPQSTKFRAKGIDSIWSQVCSSLL